MKIRSLGLSVGPVFLMLLSACSATDERHSRSRDGAAIRPLTERLKLMNRPLTQGASGEDVQTLHEFLTQYGYFPNAALGMRFPAWQAIVPQGPRDPGVFDENTAEAVRHLQRNSGLLETGWVDESTLTALKVPRCGVPNGVKAPASVEKYALQGSKWASTNLTWKVVNTNDVTLEQARNAASGALAAWANQTGLSFTHAPSAPTVDLEIRFDVIDGPNGTLAFNAFPAFGGDMTIDIAETWSVVTPTPAEQFDLQTVMLHEFGHGLGLDHSSLGSATMFPSVAPGVSDRQLDLDDNVGISAIYDTWTQLPGCARDLGVGFGGVVWAVGCGTPDAPLWRWNGTNWDADTAGGAASRVDVSPGGIPWAVVSNGSVWRKSSSSASSGSWTQLPGCAKDIGIGNDGSVWAIGCGSPDGILHKWNPSSSSWDADVTNGAAVRVTVGPTGIPWAISSNDSVWRRSSSSPFSGSWSSLPGAGKDIGINDGNHAWMIGNGVVTGGFAVFTWNEQSAISGAPARFEWINKPGGGTQIDVGANGRPWVVSSSGAIWVATQ